jgi:glycosyltransferase involved in cell wall biosynthesis
MYEDIFHTVNELRLEEQVIFPGFVSPEEKIYLLQHCEIFIYPSIYEGFGIPVLEAMLQKTPIITSNNSNLILLVENTAVTINPKSYKQLTKAIYTLISNRKKCEELRIKAYKRAKKLTNEKYIKTHYDTLFKKLINVHK